MLTITRLPLETSSFITSFRLRHSTIMPMAVTSFPAHLSFPVLPSSTVIGENLTLDQVETLCTRAASPNQNRNVAFLNFTNSLLVAITTNLNFTQNPAIGTFLNPPGTVFQATSGAGAHYLATDTYRNSGVLTINSSLLADLRQKTTIAPIQLPANFDTPTILLPQAQRNTANVPCGFSYDPIDYIWNGLNLTSSLLLTGGVAVAIGGVTGTTLTQPTGSSPPAPAFISEGGPLNMNRICRYQAVQELPIVWPTGGTGSTMSLVNVNSVLNPLPDIRLRS